jgi:hypothetical protein
VEPDVTQAQTLSEVQANVWGGQGQERLRKNRPMTSISLRMPEDIIDDLKALAPTLGFSGYQPLIRAYIGQGLRKDLARLEHDQVKLVVESLRRHGVDDRVIAEAIAEAKARTA